MIDAVPPEKRLDYLDQQLNQKRQVNFKTCADVYNYWRSCKRLYKKAPKDGVEFQVDYIDTGLALNEEVRSKAPIALALHGAPGSYHDFALLIHHLTQQNVRVIAPNFPEYTATVKTKVLFRHSADEKAAYLRDFLKAINVTTIDLLVSHSSAIFPTLLILLNASPEAVAKQKQRQASNKIHGQDVSNNRPNNNENKATKVIKSRRKDVHLMARDDIVGKQVVEIANSVVGNSNKRDTNHLTNAATANTNRRCPSGDDTVVVTSKHQETDEKADETFEDGDDDTVRVLKEIDRNNNYNCNGGDNNGADNLGADGYKPLDTATQTMHKQSNKDTHSLGGGANEDSNCQDRGAKRRRRKGKRSNQDVIVKFDQPIEIKAVALFNPAGHRMPQSMKPTWFKCGSVNVYQHKLGRSLFRKLGPAFLTVVGVPVKVDNMDNVMLSATVMRNSKCQRVVQQLEQLGKMKLPTLLVFSENDKLIEKEIFYEMTQFMRLDQKNFDIFNNDGDIELSQSLRDDWIRVMVFKAGGHYAYSNYAKTVNNAVSDLLRRVRQQQ